MHTIPAFISQLENGTPGTKLITLKSVWKTGKCTVQPVPDGRGWYVGIPRITDDEKKKLRYWADSKSRCELKDGVSFDLSDEGQRVTWEWVKFCVEIAATLEDTQSTKQAEFYVHVIEDEAAKSVAKRSLTYRAMKYVSEDSDNNLKDRATILGVNMQEDSKMVILDYLMEMAQNNPQKVIDSYENPFINLKLLMLSALSMNIIKYDGQIYRHGNTVLGVSEEAMFEFLKRSDNKAIVKLIEREVHPEYFTNDRIETNKYNEMNVSSDNDIYEKPVFHTYAKIDNDAQDRMSANDDADNLDGIIKAPKTSTGDASRVVVRPLVKKQPIKKIVKKPTTQV